MYIFFNYDIVLKENVKETGDLYFLNVINKNGGLGVLSRKRERPTHTL